ncbi:MAG: carbohydrate kinase family protein [Lachnospiraceae bacterium]|jgi:fructokinase
MEKRWDVIALGELLIDFTENGYSEQGNPVLEANPGGAPCNLLAMLNHLGRKTAFIGVVGKDSFGIYLRQILRESDIDDTCLYENPDVHTTLAFVHTAPDGDRDFAFYRNPGADMTLTEEQIDEAFLASGKAFHFGTLSMTHEGARKATKKAIRIAREKGMLLSFDPNLRVPLWDDLDTAREQIDYGMRHCDVLKISDDEVKFMTGNENIREGARQLAKEYPQITLMNVTLGKEGSIAFYHGKEVFQAPFLQENTIETTGAGDTFGGCALHYVLEHGLEDLTEKQLQEMLRFANAASSLITTRKGALRVMPTKEEIESFLMDK